VRHARVGNGNSSLGTCAYVLDAPGTRARARARRIAQLTPNLSPTAEPIQPPIQAVTGQHYAILVIFG
jgi:hypothetical protein